jgi:hypothetical protein
MLLEKQLSYIFSSNPDNGAINVSPDGSTFSVQLNQPIAIPAEAIHATLEVQSANVWWTIPSVSARLGNNKLYIYSEWITPDGGIPPNYPNYEITIADGLYSLDGLSAAIGRELANQTLPSNLISLSGDDSTQRTIITFNYSQPTALDFTRVDTFREILGFNARSVPVTPKPAGFSEYSDNVAEFNQISSFLINTDLISDGIPVNNTSSGTIANVLIDVVPGKLINYTPVISVKANADELIGKSKNFFTFRLTDQDRGVVDTNSEYYSLTVIIKYYIPFTAHTKSLNASSRG